jgi:hypothetical protein
MDGLTWLLGGAVIGLMLALSMRQDTVVVQPMPMERPIGGGGGVVLIVGGIILVIAYLLGSA